MNKAEFNVQLMVIETSNELGCDLSRVLSVQKLFDDNELIV